HRSQKDADTGLGTPQDFTYVTAPASRSTYVLKPDAKALGGLAGVEDAHEPAGVDAYLAGRG
ncbi:ABC transporter substrate-binding protein, partial [Streptomyces sp. SID6648]|nr:ABC transporter substrate-binding protein [Streptomyces sp. SID6648]